MTPRLDPQVSQAVLDARAHRSSEPAGCAAAPTSPVSAGFEFGEAALTVASRQALDSVVAWSGCHPQAPLVVRGAADGHGTPADQAALSARRVDTAIGYLTGHGVTAARLRRLAAGEAEPAGEHLLILAEGKRW